MTIKIDDEFPCFNFQMIQFQMIPIIWPYDCKMWLSLMIGITLIKVGNEAAFDFMSSQ